jgi:hypothetical protein
VEETIGYESLFSAEDWSSLQNDEWALADEDFELQAADPDTKHEVRIYETKTGFDVECELCGSVGSADDESMAQVLGRFHETLQAMVVQAMVVEEVTK